MPSVFEASTDPDALAAEQAVNRYLDDFESAGRRRRWFLLLGPVSLARSIARVGALDRLSVAPGRTPEGELLRDVLDAMRSRVRTPLHAVSGVLTIPRRPGEYEAGSSKQTLRRKARHALRRGITWDVVDDLDERRSLMDLADRHERSHGDEQYRNAAAEHAELVPLGLWLVARAENGRPLLLSVTPVDGEVAALRYFRTLASGDDASTARYLMTQVLVEQLRLRGVRHLLDTTPSMRLPHGLRHFQRMVGFRLVRVELAPRTPDSLPGRIGVQRPSPRTTGTVLALAVAFGSEVLPAVLTF